MAVKIRLQRHGRRKRPFYHIVVADARAPRDGRFIEKIGYYNPMTSPATIEVDRDKAFDWMAKGAQPTDTARAILRFKGVLYKRHLMRGVKKGAMTLEQAEAKFNTFIEEKDAKVIARFEKSAQAELAHLAKISGVANPVEVVVEEVAEEVVETTEEVVAEATEAAAEVVAEEVVETTTEEVVAEATEAAVEETKTDDTPPAAE